MELKKSEKVLIHLGLWIFIILTVAPFIWMVLTSIKTLGESLLVPPQIFPKIPQWKNYYEVLILLPFKEFYLNTTIATIFIVLGQMFFCSLAAYGFGRFDFPFKNIIFLVVLSILMIPTQLYLIPQYKIISKMGLLNTVPALIIPGLFSAYGTFLLKQFIEKLPRELEEAAIIDGANQWQVFTKVIFPLITPALTAHGILTALWSWKALLWPLIVNSTIEKMTISAGLSQLTSRAGTNYPMVMAGVVWSLIPMVILFIIFQKKFISGIATSGLKG